MGAEVQEIPGYYGSVKMEEAVLQRIWAEQDFFTDSLVTTCGKKIFTDHVGKWNLSEEGPDFRNARLIIDGAVVDGDIEVHFEPKDWQKHKHHLDSNYNRVILQICLFLKATDKSGYACTQNGKDIPCLILLPHLYRGIEEYGEEHALARLSGRDRQVEKEMECLKGLSELGVGKRARRRWSAKLIFAQSRLHTQGWEAACHQWFLEILGYRRNKGPMARIAQRISIDEWKSGRINAEKVFQSEKGWRLRGCRPANHPVARLRQYADLCSSSPQWMEKLSNFTNRSEIDSCPQENGLIRVSTLARFWRDEILGGIFAKSKANTLWIDGAWPLLCVSQKIEGFAIWHNWPAGDCPKKYREWARKLGWTDRSGRKPFSNGQFQCILESLNEEMIHPTDNSNR